MSWVPERVVKGLRRLPSRARRKWIGITPFRGDAPGKNADAHAAVWVTVAEEGVRLSQFTGGTHARWWAVVWEGCHRVAYHIGSVSGASSSIKNPVWEAS